MSVNAEQVAVVQHYNVLFSHLLLRSAATCRWMKSMAGCFFKLQMIDEHFTHLHPAPPPLLQGQASTAHSIVGEDQWLRQHSSTPCRSVAT